MIIIRISIDIDYCAFAEEMFGKLPRIQLPESITLRIRGLVREKKYRAERVIMKPIVTEHYGCKRARHCKRT